MKRSYNTIQFIDSVRPFRIFNLSFEPEEEQLQLMSRHISVELNYKRTLARNVDGRQT